jgi:hypothetical protein
MNKEKQWLRILSIENNYEDKRLGKQCMLPQWKLEP